MMQHFYTNLMSWKLRMRKLTINCKCIYIYKLLQLNEKKFKIKAILK